MKKITLEIENYFGDTICAFTIDLENENIVTETIDCDLADIDGDNIFDTDNLKVRVQLNYN